MDKEEWPERRRRHPVQLEAEIMQADGRSAPTIVSDLSLDGCRVAGWFRIGEAVTLRIPRIGVVNGQVRWAVSGRAGIRFIANVEG